MIPLLLLACTSTELFTENERKIILRMLQEENQIGTPAISSQKSLRHKTLGKAFSSTHESPEKFRILCHMP